MLHVSMCCMSYIEQVMDNVRKRSKIWVSCQDAEIVVSLLHAIHISPVPATAVRVAVGEERLRRLLDAQVRAISLTCPAHHLELS